MFAHCRALDIFSDEQIGKQINISRLQSLQSKSIRLWP